MYGGPCAPGQSCNVILEANLASEDLYFDFRLFGIQVADHHVTDFILFLGSGEASVPVDASGHGVIPAGAGQYRAFWRGNGVEKQAIGFFSSPVEFDVDWTTRTLTVSDATLSLDGSSASVSISGTFGESLLEELGGLCPGPEFAEPEVATLPACAAGSLGGLEPPSLVFGCADESPQLTGEVIFAGGQELSPPIPLTAGVQFPAGDILVRWTVTDSRGRFDEVEQAVEVTSRPAVVATHSLDLGDRFVVEEPGGNSRRSAKAQHARRRGPTRRAR